MAVLLAVGLVPTFGIEGAAVAQAVGALFFAIVLLIFTRRSSGQWLGAKTWLWLAVCGVALGLGSWLMTKAPSPYWGLLPTTLTAALCVGIYFKIIAKERHADELA
jgi:peptidoglycan biosynthesis protein MviN/MurJ (putative lipid II flippase)